MNIITLTTDFGTQDGYVGVMKGVILGINPEVRVIDISHDLPPQDIRFGALTLATHVKYFLKGTVHVIVIDPGVGTARRPIAARIGEQYFVAPDNGVLTPFYEEAEEKGWPVEVVHTNNPNYWLSDISSTFHGRDIFSPVGAHLSSGVPLEELGTVIDDPVRIEFPKAEKTGKGWKGEVVRMDRFGNLRTNLSREEVGEGTVAVVRIGGVEIEGMVGTFGESPVGELVAMWGSSGYLGVSIVNGNAARDLDVGVGAAVEIEFE
jgi:S-adenosylmethionine hydrolase